MDSAIDDAGRLQAAVHVEAMDVAPLPRDKDERKVAGENDPDMRGIGWIDADDRHLLAWQDTFGQLSQARISLRIITLAKQM